jgi:hypothetical protein
LGGGNGGEGDGEADGGMVILRERDFTAVSATDIPGDGQAQTAAGSLAGEKGFEEKRECFRGQRWPGILHLELDTAGGAAIRAKTNSFARR